MHTSESCYSTCTLKRSMSGPMWSRKSLAALLTSLDCVMHLSFTSFLIGTFVIAFGKPRAPSNSQEQGDSRRLFNDVKGSIVTGVLWWRNDKKYPTSKERERMSTCVICKHATQEGKERTVHTGMVVSRSESSSGGPVMRMSRITRYRSLRAHRYLVCPACQRREKMIGASLILWGFPGLFVLMGVSFWLGGQMPYQKQLDPFIEFMTLWFVLFGILMGFTLHWQTTRRLKNMAVVERQGSGTEYESLDLLGLKEKIGTVQAFDEKEYTRLQRTNVLDE